MNSKEINTSIAGEIWRQMNTLDRMLVWAMGTNKLEVIERGLRFKVRGLNFRGHVSIQLNAMDLYDVSLINGKDSRTFDDVYFDELMPLLGREVEGDK